MEKGNQVFLLNEIRLQSTFSFLNRQLILYVGLFFVCLHFIVLLESYDSDFIHSMITLVKQIDNKYSRYFQLYILHFVTGLALSTCGRSILSHSLAIKLGHKTCFGQWNVSQDDVCHFRREVLTGILSFCQLSCLSFGKRMAYFRCCLLLTAWILE